MKIAVLNYPHAILSSVHGPYDMFSQVNGMVSAFRPDIKIPTLDVSILLSNQVMETDKFDLVIIPAMQFAEIESVIASNQHLIPWLHQQYQQGCEIASVCMGAFLLAESGLLNNSSATTHWLGAGIFKEKYPQVKLVDDKFITDFQRIYTSGGAFSFTSLIIYLMDKYFGNEVAILMSKVFLVHIHDSKQSGYKILGLQKNHKNKAIQEIQNYIEEHIEEQFPVEEIAAKAHMSLRTFMRNFKKATGDTPNAYIQKVRVEKAKKLLEGGAKSIEEISIQVGYNDFASFRKTFKKTVGLNPSEYKKLYNRVFSEVNVEH
ncbi:MULTISPECIES: GlxA family transcriptional regulator [unclassified Saccharicrinis]|uniref:GlxA family transcriptional regulator n=1 Tax=unclassified Saccharicrinis TaxID=2646859 RepID=UPI003D335D7D